MGTTQTGRERLSLDNDWRFHRGDIAVTNFRGFGDGRDPAVEWIKAGDQGIAKVGYDDAHWEAVNVPHDFVIGGTPDPSADKEHGSLPVGIGWYRKSFSLTEEDRGKRLSLEFDGVYRDCAVWVNGHFLGRHLSGYIGFRFDFTDVANFGEENVVAVRADATKFEGWWYEGGGVYRHVWLTKTALIHIAPQGIVVRTEIEEGRPLAGAVVAITVEIENESEDDAPASCRVVCRLFDPEGVIVSEMKSGPLLVSAGGAETVSLRLRVPAPRLWSPETPELYRLETEINQDETIIDRVETTFGVRTMRFDAERGFILNGLPYKIKGFACHQDFPGVGVALPDRLHEYKLERLKEIGANAYRTAHHPAAPELMDACDRLGLLVMAENRLCGTSPEILAQLEALIRRDRNHPSVFLWSIGNEEHILQTTEVGARIVARMVKHIRRLDPTRPATLAMNGHWHGKAAAELQVLGCNYAHRDYDRQHAARPHQPMIGTENGGAVFTRGVYSGAAPPGAIPHYASSGPDDPDRGYVSAYGDSWAVWGASPEETWRAIAERPFVAGGMIWTGFDYKGEPFPMDSWPLTHSNYGVMDTCGFPKDVYYWYRSWWTHEPTLHLLPHWNWEGREGEDICVVCFSNCVAVELSLNGQSLGERRMEPLGRLSWAVPYEPGVVQARGWTPEGKEILHRIETTGPPAELRLIPNRHILHADGRDVCVVRVGVADAQGRIVPTADNLVTFEVTGAGRLIGVGNGDPCSHEPDKSDRRSVFHGLGLALIQTDAAPGRIQLIAHAPTLTSASAIIEARAV